MGNRPIASLSLAAAALAGARLAAAGLAAAGLPACDPLDDARPGPLRPPAPSGAVSSSGGGSAAGDARPPSGPGSSQQGDGVLEVLKLTLTAKVDKREPVGTLTAAGVGERAYAHVVVRNRRKQGETLTVRFTVDGEERSSVDLDVASSWSYRTWAYATPQKKDVGKTLEVEVFERGGRSLAKASAPVATKVKER